MGGLSMRVRKEHSAEGALDAHRRCEKRRGRQWDGVVAGAHVDAEGETIAKRHIRAEEQHKGVIARLHWQHKLPGVLSAGGKTHFLSMHLL